MTPSDYGFFDDECREYVITRPDTPLPWINYLGLRDYVGLISNTAGGYAFYRDARLRRITRYRYNNVPFDEGGRYLYLRDTDTGDYWSPTWQPTRCDLEDYSCRHGMGYTVIESTHRDIEARIKYFVPMDQTLEIWQLMLRNRRDTTARLSLFSLIEYCLWDAQDDATNFQRNFNTAEVEVEDEVIYHKTEYRERRNHFAYFACSEPLSGFDTQREAFLGPYRGWDAPAVVEQDASSNSIAHGWSPIGSHHVRLVLDPGESHEIIFLLGYHENLPDEKFDPPGSQRLNKATVKPVIERHLDPAAVEAAFRRLGEHWDRLLSTLQVSTPDLDVNRMVNVWNAYQCMVTFNLSRSASFFESGIGRGIGFRDSNQDILGFVHMAPERARDRILDLAATQMTTGGAYHQFQPLTKRGNDEIGGGFNDDPLWLVLSVSAYLKESGDWSILDAPVPYENQPGSEEPLYAHLRRSLDYTLDRLGPHGLPLIGRADWNDCLNLNVFSADPDDSFQTAPLKKDGTVAESVFIAGLFVLAARELAPIAERRGLEDDAKHWLDAASRMEACVDEHGWDGDWFLRAYDAHGEPVGSHICEEGRIYIEPQGMCIMAGIGLQNGRAAQALDAVETHLMTIHGVMLHQPAYTSYQVRLGEISSYPPGYKENGSIFCHTNPWIAIAETMLGRGNLAHHTYRLTNPSARESISDIHRCEPYVYAQTIAGRDAITRGEAKNSWLTGTAAWNYVAVTQWILGVRPTHDGLRIAPIVPPNWPGFQATRRFRGTTYHISVERVGPGNEVTLIVDGEPIKGNVVRLPPESIQAVTVRAQIA